jgi:signal transduction histidine kinase/CheY-like chemotaxis protein
VAVPLKIKNDFFGILYIANRNPTVFSQFDIDILSKIGDLAATQIMRKKEVERMRKIQGVLEKRIDECGAELKKTKVRLEQETEECKKMKTNLRKSQRFYRDLFENAPVAFWIEDYSGVKTCLDGVGVRGVQNLIKFFDERPEAVVRCAHAVKPVDVNRAALELYEAGVKEEIFERIWRQQVCRAGIRCETNGKDPNIVFKKELIAISDHKIFETDCSAATIKGNELFVLIKSSVLPCYWDSWSKVLVSIHDLTERINAKKEQKRLEALLRHAQKMEAIGTLAGGIAHDFNNALAAIIGYTEIASFHLPSQSKARNSLMKVLQASERAKNLVNQILSLTRHRENQLKPIQIGSIVKEALKLLRASLPATIEIRRRITGDPEIVEADPSQVHQILMNLCSNAAHAMRKNGGVLEVSLTKTDVDANMAERDARLPPGAYLKLSVSDTGHGIPPEIMDRIFEPHFTTKEKGEGTGLGLAVVQGIAKSCGFHITVESEKGKGSTFSVYFPRKESKSDAVEANEASSYQTGRECILFVDDEQPLVDIGKEMLEHLGYTVVGTTSSIEALKLFRTHPDRFDLIITDMTMPDMTGKKLAEEIMNLRPDIPIILCTGFSDIITSEKAQSIGIRKLLIKPFTMGSMAGIIREALNEG